MWDKWWEPIPCSTVAQRRSDGIENGAGRCLSCPGHLPCPWAALAREDFFFAGSSFQGFCLVGFFFFIIRAQGG